MLLNTKRIFNRVFILTDLQLSSEHLDRVAVLLNVHGCSIKTMRIVAYNQLKIRIEAHSWLEIFKKLPNLEELDLKISNYTVIKSPGVSEPEFLQKKLQSLTLCLAGEGTDIQGFLDHLQIASLRKLDVKSYWDAFDDFIKRHSKVTNLSIPERNFTQSFEHLELDSFSVFNGDEDEYCNALFEPDDDYFIPTVKNEGLYKQLNDKLLKLIQAHPNIKNVTAWCHSDRYFPIALREDVIKALCQLPSLRNFYHSITHASKIDTADLIRSNACEVHFQYCFKYNDFKIPNLNEILKMKNLQKLSIGGGWNENFTTKAPSLQHLKIEFYHVNNDRLARILSSFEGLECLELENFRGSAKVISNGVIYPRLKIVKIESFKFDGDFELFLKAFPNIESLHLQKCKITFSDTLMNHFLAMRKLKRLTIELDLKEQDFPANAVAALEKLCNILTIFEISFKNVPSTSHATLQEFSRHCNVSNFPQSCFILFLTEPYNDQLFYF